MARLPGRHRCQAIAAQPLCVISSTIPRTARTALKIVQRRPLQTATMSLCTVMVRNSAWNW